MVDVNDEQFIKKYKSVGFEQFYKFLITYAINMLINIENIGKNVEPHLDYLKYSDRFVSLYRRDDQEIYLEIASAFRKAANKIYRIMLKKNLTNKNDKFLNLVK